MTMGASLSSLQNVTFLGYLEQLFWGKKGGEAGVEHFIKVNIPVHFTPDQESDKLNCGEAKAGEILGKEKVDICEDRRPEHRYDGD